MTDPSPHLERIRTLVVSAGPQNVGDSLDEALRARAQLSDPLARMVAETMLAPLRGLAARADVGWRVFSANQQLPRPLDDVELLQLVSLERALHELCYACESVELAAATSWGGSSPTRFYLNSIYHYISSMFLVDTSSPRQKNLPSGGTAIRALHPMGLDSLLDPIAALLSEPLTSQISFGDTILRLRHSYLVHGDFSPRRIEYLIAQSEMRSPEQIERFASLIWDLFYQIILLRLRIIALFTHNALLIEPAMLRYLMSVGALPASFGAG
jgi:hypothetical protein